MNFADFRIIMNVFLLFFSILDCLMIRKVKWLMKLRARLQNEVKANRETCKSAEKCMCTILYGNARRKANRYAFKNGMANVFLRECSGG